MSKNKVLKLAISDLILLFLDVGAFLGLLYLERTPLIVAALSTVIFVSIPTFFYINFTAVSDIKKIDYLIDDLDEDEEFYQVFGQYKKSPSLGTKVEVATGQLKRLDNKSRIIEKVLLQNYNEGLKEFSSINGVIDDTREIIYRNMRDIVNQMTIFDDDELTEINNSPNISNEIKNEKRKSHGNRLNLITDILDKNEYVLLEIDKLIEATARLNGKSTETKDLERIRDIVNSLQQLNGVDEDNDSLDNLMDSYDKTEYKTNSRSLGKMEE